MDINLHNPQLICFSRISKFCNAKKELKKNVKRNAANKQIKENIKNLTKKTVRAINTKDANTINFVKESIKAIDKAAKKGLIKKNTANRKKSKLQKKANTAKK